MRSGLDLNSHVDIWPGFTECLNGSTATQKTLEAVVLDLLSLRTMPVSPSSALQIVINNPGKLELGSLTPLELMRIHLVAGCKAAESHVEGR